MLRAFINNYFAVIGNNTLNCFSPDRIPLKSPNAMLDTNSVSALASAKAPDGKIDVKMRNTFFFLN